MKDLKNLPAMGLAELSADQARQVSGGESVVRYTDSQGYSWEYYFDDGGNMTGFCVVQAMVIH
jgi:hypothetical protein